MLPILSQHVIAIIALIIKIFLPELALYLGTAEAAWREQRAKNHAILSTLCKDIDRTFSEFPFFQDPKNQRMLVGKKTCRISPIVLGTNFICLGSGTDFHRTSHWNRWRGAITLQVSTFSRSLDYSPCWVHLFRQGMHELLAVIIMALYKDIYRQGCNVFFCCVIIDSTSIPLHFPVFLKFCTPSEVFCLGRGDSSDKEKEAHESRTATVSPSEDGITLYPLYH